MATEEAVLAYLRAEHTPLYELAAWTRRAVLSADPDLAERVYRGWRGIGFRHPEAGYVGAIFARGDGIVLLFERGASLPDPGGVLQGEGTQTRFMRVVDRSRGTRALIVAYVQQATAQRLLER